jgi:hypothetical protein
MYWIQPATVLIAYYHYFHGHGEDVASHAVGLAYEMALSGLRWPLRIRDMPSFIIDDATGSGKGISKMVLQGFRQHFEQMDEEGMMVLVNTFEAREARPWRRSGHTWMEGSTTLYSLISVRMH